MEELQQNKSALEGSGKPLLKKYEFPFSLGSYSFFKFRFSLFLLFHKRGT